MKNVRETSSLDPKAGAVRPAARAGTGGEPAGVEGRGATGRGNSEGTRREARGPFFDVVFTFIDIIIAGDPGHPLSRVQNS